jgi:hypothetical protein
MEDNGLIGFNCILPIIESDVSFFASGFGDDFADTNSSYLDSSCEIFHKDPTAGIVHTVRGG